MKPSQNRAKKHGKGTPIVSRNQLGVLKIGKSIAARWLVANV